MASNLLNDTEENRVIDRIRAIAFKEIADEGCEFVTRDWVAQRLRRSERWVTRNWNKR